MENKNRFDDFFGESSYVFLKNSLYNYRLRRRAVTKNLDGTKGPYLEAGSGISPLLKTEFVSGSFLVCSDISFTAMKKVKDEEPHSEPVVLDMRDLPFKSGSFGTIVCSEALEHISDDTRAIREMSRILSADATLILTFPHREFYFAVDDVFVGHYRRYELEKVTDLLQRSSLHIQSVHKVLGPCEKLTMIGLFFILRRLESFGRQDRAKKPPGNLFVKAFRFLNTLYMPLMWLDSLLAPRFLSAVLLIKARKASAAIESQA